MNVLDMSVSPFSAWLWKATLQGSLVVCLVLLIKLVLRHRLPARWHYVLWLVLLVRLSLPWAPQSRLSVYNLFERPQRARPVARDVPAVGSESGTEGALDASHAPSRQAGPEDSVHRPSGATEPPSPVPAAPTPVGSVPIEGRWRLAEAVSVLPVLWLIGAIVLGGYVLARNVGLWCAVRRERPVTDQETLDALEDGKMQMGVQTIVGLVVTDRIQSPALFGFVRPRILLPEGLLEALTLDELQYVFLHELAHLKRRDIYLGWLVSLLQVLHWFNPLIWLAFRRMRADQEMACDALALSRMTPEEPPAYGRTIVNLLARFSQPHYVPSVAGILEEPSNIERRMTMIARFNKNSCRWSPLAVILMIILACVSLPDAHRMKASETSAARAAPEPTLRRIEVRTPGRVHSRPSPDGRYLSGVDDAGNLIVRELATGRQRKLTAKEPESKGFAHRSLISPDSTRVAYYWFSAEKEDFDLRVVGLDGSNDRLLWAADDGARSFNMHTWSPDGEHIFGAFLAEDKAVQLMRVSADDGSRKVVKEFDRARFFTAGVSPDGRHIAYDVADSETSKRDVFVLDLKANRETPLVKHPANDKLLGWTPDGRHIFFASDRNGTWDGWLLPVDGGTPRGLPEMIKAGLGNVAPVGFTRSGSFYYQFRHQGWNVYVAGLDPDTSDALSEPDPVRLVGKDVWPDWSPDGRYLAYCSEPDRSQAQIIRIRTLATGQERELKPDLAHFDYLRWCPDSRHLLITDFGRESPSVVYRLDAATGESTILVQSDEPRIRQAELSADGKTLAYKIRGRGTMNRLIVRDLRTGTEKELLQTPMPGALALAPGSGWALSPDGKYVALSIREDAGKPFVLKIMSVESGECRTLDAEWIFQMAWTRDGRDLLVTKNVRELWRVSVKGEESQKLLEWNGMIMGPRIHPDGQRLAFFSGARMSELWVMENFLPTAVTLAGK